MSNILKDIHHISLKCDNKEQFDGVVRFYTETSGKIYENFPNQQLFDLKMGYKRLQLQLKALESKESKTPFDLQRINALKKQMEDLRGQVGGFRKR